MAFDYYRVGISFIIIENYYNNNILVVHFLVGLI